MPTLSATHPLQHLPDHPKTFPGSVGVERDNWYAEARRAAGTVVVTMTASDPASALQQLVTSGDPIDCWFKDEVRALTGVGLAGLFRPILIKRRVRVMGLPARG